MNVDIISHRIDHLFIASECKRYYPTIKIDLNKTSELDRLIKKLIRDRSVILNLCTVQLKITCPLFVFFEIKEMVPWNSMYTDTLINTDDLTFETSEDFSNAEETSLLCLMKKVKTLIKDIDQDKMKYFLPMSCHIKVWVILNYLQLYEFLSKLHQTQEERKVSDFRELLMKKLENHDISLFNNELVELYKTTERK